MKKFNPIRSAAFNACLHLGVLACVAPLASSTSAFAQLSGKGAITGIVQDPSGAAVPGATIVITKDATGVATTVKSSSSGDFNVTTLDPGVYSVTVTANGFETLTQKNITVNALESSSFSPKLVVGSTGETVTVTTAPPQLQTADATLGATMDQEMYSALPIQMGAGGNADQRRATDFASLLPGVQGTETNGNNTTNTGVINGSGDRGAASAVYIDGVPFTQVSGEGDPRFVWTAISVDAVDQLQVQTAGYSAEYEGQGIENFTIKQGGNKYHGTAYEFLRNTALDTYGFFVAVSPSTGLPTKRVEHQNEFGIALSGPLVPFGSFKDKLFFFGNYNGYRYSATTPTYNTFPTVAEQNGDFTGVTQTIGGVTATVPIYDPNTQTACTAASTTGPCRYQYGYVGAGGTGPAGNPVVGPLGAAGVNKIPAAEFSPIALAMQKTIPTLTNQNPVNNYLAPNHSGLVNFSTTDRIDYTISPKDTLTLTAAIGRQASSYPVGQNTSGRGVGPEPYNYSQAYAPKTAVGIVEETHVFSNTILNQFKYGFARYNGPTFNVDYQAPYAATNYGITNLPAGQASGAFPITTFAGTDAPTQWAGTTGSSAIANSYTLLDNLQLQFGKHSITVGAELAWLQYQTLSATGNSAPVTIANAVTETAGFAPSTNAKPTYTTVGTTGLSYASFLIGQINSESVTSYLVAEYGARFRPISPYIQDEWKVTPKLTLNIGVRYDFYPTYHEVHDNESFFNPALANPYITTSTGGALGGLQYAGTGANTCNCDTPVNNYYKNIGPRLGMAYQIDPKTVIRASYGVFYTHGNAVGGGTNSRTGTGTLGFSGSGSSSASGQALSQSPLTAANTAFVSVSPAAGRASGSAYGTGYTTATGFTGTPLSVGYGDPYLGGRAPQYENYSLGFQHQWTNTLVTSISYVGSQGHFLVADGSNARGFYADQLDPKYLTLGSTLSTTGATETAACTANNLPCPIGFNTGQSLATALKPFPEYSVADSFGYVANANYNSLQVAAQMRATHGLSLMANYTWARSIDDDGTFRTGYFIPAAVSPTGKDIQQDRIERTVSVTNQPHHAVITAVYDLPFGKEIFAGHRWERAVFGGFKFSNIFQVYSGSPLAIIGSSCGTNPAQATCMPTYNPAYAGGNRARIGGGWGHGVTYTNTAVNFINPAAFTPTAAYVFGNTPRTAPYNLIGPGYYDVDISLRRSFALHLGEGTSLSLQADLYNVTNHTQFGGIGVSYGSSNFGQVSSQTNAPRQAQLSGRINF